MNITKSGSLKRSIVGLFLILLGFGLGFLFYLVPTNPWFKFSIFIPFYFGHLCRLEGKYQTCIIYAGLAKKNVGSGTERVADPSEKKELLRKSQIILIKSFVLAFIFMMLSLLFSPLIISMKEFMV